MTASTTLSVTAIVISLFAVIFTGLQWRESHNQLLLAMKPSINILTETDPETSAGISIQNAGPGPAKIKSITYFVNKKPVADAEKALEFAKVPKITDDVYTLELEEGDTLGVGQTEWLIKYAKKPRGKNQQEELDKFLDFIDQDVAIQVEFCPVLGNDCAKKCSRTNWCD